MYVVVFRWTNELLCGEYKWVSPFKAPCICTRWTGERQVCNQGGRRGRRGAKRPYKFFRLPWKNAFSIVENYWTLFKNFGPLSENSSSPLVPKLVTGLVSAKWRRCPRSMSQRARDSVAPLQRSSAGWMTARIGRLCAGVGRAVESEVPSSDSDSDSDSWQFRLSDSNSDSGPTPTFSCISYLKW